MRNLAVVCWKWKSPFVPSHPWGMLYSADHVNRMRGMVRRHLKYDHEFYCITDDPTGLDEFVRVVPIETFGPMLPKCLHRLGIFGPAADALDARFVLQLDIDQIVTQSLAPLISFEHELSVWKCPSKGRHGFAYNPSFLMFDRTAANIRLFWDGLLAHGYEEPLANAKGNGWTGSDQAVISNNFTRQPGKMPFSESVRTLTQADGLYSYRDHFARAADPGLPKDARVVGFYDRFDPSDKDLQSKHPWIYKHWRSLRMDLIDVLVKSRGWTAGAELGVFRGDTFLHLLQRNPGLSMVGVDTWTPNTAVAERGTDGARSYANAPLSKFEANIRAAAEKYGERAKLIRDDTAAAASQVPDRSLDFVFIDADHTEVAVRADVKAWAPKLRAGGWLMGHDYFAKFPGVMRVVDELLPKRRLHQDFCWSIPVEEIAWL